MNFVRSQYRQEMNRRLEGVNSQRRLARRPTSNSASRSSGLLNRTRPVVARSLHFDTLADSVSLGSSSSNFYGSRSRPRQDFQWQPGQTLPLPSNGIGVYEPESMPPESSHDESISTNEQNFGGLLNSFKNSLDSKLKEVSDKLTSINDRMSALESRQHTLETEIKEHGSSASPSSACSESERRRKRLTPVALQSRIRTFHNSLGEDLQFKPEESIASVHNVGVVKKIEDAVSDQGFSPDVIRIGCRTYKKTIASRIKQNTTPVKKKKLSRSLKQRAYERRSRVVKEGRERTFWKDITPEMMSDEERVGDIYIQHTPSYRSQKLEKFIKKLDERAAKGGKSHARFQRQKGSPWKQPVPLNAKSWTVKKDPTPSNPPLQSVPGCSTNNDTTPDPPSDKELFTTDSSDTD